MSNKVYCEKVKRILEGEIRKRQSIDKMCKIESKSEERLKEEITDVLKGRILSKVPDCLLIIKCEGFKATIYVVIEESRQGKLSEFIQLREFINYHKERYRTNPSKSDLLTSYPH